MSIRSRWIASVLVVASTPAFAQNLTVTPNAGQSQTQMQQDIASCQTIAQQAAASQGGTGGQRGGGGARQGQQKRTAKSEAANTSTDAYVGCLQGLGYTVKK